MFAGAVPITTTREQSQSAPHSPAAVGGMTGAQSIECESVMKGGKSDGQGRSGSSSNGQYRPLSVMPPLDACVGKAAQTKTIGPMRVANN